MVLLVTFIVRSDEQKACKKIFKTLIRFINTSFWWGFVIFQDNLFHKITSCEVANLL